MIVNLLNTMLITLGTGASVLTMPKKQPTPPQNRATQNYSITITRGNEAIAETQIIQGETQYSYRINYTATNQAMTVLGSMYQNNVFLEPSQNDKETVKIGQGNNKTYAMYIYQITPYAVAINNEITTRLKTRIYNPYWLTIPNEEFTNYYYDQRTYITNENWSNYINLQDYGAVNKINSIEQEITAPENGYIYQEQTQRIQINGVNNESTYRYTEIENNITLTVNQTTYVIMILNFYAYNTARQTETTTVEFVRSTNYDQYEVFNFDANNMATITGTFIIAEANTEIVDIPGLMFQVLTMPFTFISAAFNLTLFPGTPYQINISNLFMAIIAVMAFIFILKLLIGMKGGN